MKFNIFILIATPPTLWFYILATCRTERIINTLAGTTFVILGVVLLITSAYSIWRKLCTPNQ